MTVTVVQPASQLPLLNEKTSGDVATAYKFPSQETLGWRFASPLTQAILYLHPHIAQSHDPSKGRTLRADRPIKAGELVMADLPYAVVPVADPAETVVCSNLGCSRSIPRDAPASVPCRAGCVPDVRWCNEACRAEDQARHDFECAWLQKYGRRLRQEVDAHDRYLLWIIVRILAARHLERRQATPANMQHQYTSQDRFASSWAGVQALRRNREAWPAAQTRHWADLAGRYLQPHEGEGEGEGGGLLPSTLGLDETLDLICAEETNVFELCPGPPEIIPGVHREAGRGAQYGLALFLRITLANHSCNPNLTHQADDRGRMMVTALRDIAAGEECCTSYFDLMEYADLAARRGQTEKLFTFTCACSRCLEEEAEAEAAQRN